MNLLRDAGARAAEALAAGCGKVGSTRKQFVVALVLFLLAVLLLQQVAWTSFPDWVKQQVAWDVLKGSGGVSGGSVSGQDEYGPRVTRKEWYRLRNVPDGATGSWEEQFVRNVSYAWCDKFSCPYETLMQQPVASGWWLANSSTQCPGYFKWIEEDLAPWNATGVSLENVLAARRFAHFRVTIVKGKLYAEYYIQTFETRGLFTLWGLAMLLEKYPDLVPDVDFVVTAGDWPSVPKSDFHDPGAAPLVFGYCSTRDHYNVPFPDWSFWGWPEVMVFPWERLGAEIFQAAEKNRWDDRKNISFWRGNPWVGNIRKVLLDCDVSRRPGSSVEAVQQDWGKERASGFKSSNLASHCEYKYMIYAEGNAWSVSYKYTLACGSPMLAIESSYYEFFTRSLQPNVHYLGVRRHQLCDSIDSQVAWANSHQQEAKAVAERGLKFLQQDLSMDFVYGYMLHLLQAYAKLQRFQPSVPPHAEELCPAKLLCSASPQSQEIMRMNTIPTRISHQPCTMPPSQ